MPGTITVSLHKLIFRAYHGLYPEERKTGNDFEVNLAVQYEPADEVVTAISSTINYATLAELVKKNMLQPADLLETLAMQIAADIHQEFPQVKHIDISIAKLHPPVISFQGNVSVRYTCSY